MVLRLRGAARTVSAVLIALSLWSLPHRSQPDICVPPAFEPHNESRQVLTAASAHAADEHCVVCHWMRSVKDAFAGTSYEGAVPVATATPPIPVSLRVAAFALDQLPARAPPLRLQ